MQALHADGLEILVARELRKAGIDPTQLHRVRGSLVQDKTGYVFDLFGRVEAYGHRWTALVECRGDERRVQADHIDALSERARTGKAASALLFATAGFEENALRRAAQQRIATLQVVDAQTAFTAAGLIEGGQMPAWVPEHTAQLIWYDGGVRTLLLDANDPEPLLRLLRRSS